MRIEPKFKLPIGFIGKVKYPNTHDVPKGTKFKILDYDSDRSGYPQYVVVFIGRGVKQLNDTRPYLNPREVDFGENGDLFYAK